MAATAGDISEDWEHVDDGDNFSVISLPTSEDDSLEHPRARPAIPNSSSPSDNLVPSSHRPRSEALTQRRASRLPEASRTSKTKGSQPPETCVTSTPDVVKSATPRAKPRDRISSDRDFGSLAETASSLLILIPQLHSALVQARCLPYDFAANCEKIRVHLDNLRDILHGYAKYERLSGRAAGLPVGVSEWLGSLKLELLAIQAMLSTPAPEVRGSIDVLVNGHFKKLKGFSSQMDGLMAVIQR